jgi:ABC-type sugar transport system ATPase subunit
VSQPLSIELRSISKRYSGVLALDDVSVRIDGGQIHALVGENGAGKSTLGKIIAGAVRPDAGTFLIDGRPVVVSRPRDAIRAGIALIDQELALVPGLSVADNVFLGHEPTRRGVVDRRRERERLASAADAVGFEADLSVPVGSLRTAAQQQVEILRALMRDARLIVMDEPTAALSREEAERLTTVARRLRADGVTIVFVSHFLEDVLALSDVVTVLKDGVHVKTTPAAGETVETLVQAMLGRELGLIFPKQVPAPPGAPVALRVGDLRSRAGACGADLEVRAGEIVGLAGLVGSGRTEIARAIFGADASEGDVEVDGRPFVKRSPTAAIRRGLALLPESRKDEGLVLHRPISENVTMAHLESVSPGGVVRGRVERRLVGDLLKRLQVRASSARAPVATLSGGNQQKVALAKWLVEPPRLLIADEPTRGVDVGAKRAIYEDLRDLAASGVGILLISSELAEVRGLAHRILVVRGGRIVAEFDRGTDEESIMQAAFGAVPREGRLAEEEVSS